MAHYFWGRTPKKVENHCHKGTFITFTGPTLVANLSNKDYRILSSVRDVRLLKIDLRFDEVGLVCDDIIDCFVIGIPNLPSPTYNTIL